jgi:cellulose synthase/poly-beta-1,6-N-acetylglucosamine synthase-like glycosyltransferase
MIEILTILSWLFAIALTPLVLVFTLEVWLGIGRTRAIELVAPMPDTCILIPAHNEAVVIAQTLERLRPILSEATRVVVVADNCSDETVAIARGQGFEVLERFDTDQRGKGFALAFGRDYLRADPPECVIVLDADCHMDARSIAALAQRCITQKLAIQARYVFEPTHAAPPNVQISNFAFWLKNVVRQRGACRAGGGAILTGTGMAFPWGMFERIPLATGSIVEDLSLTVDLVRSGEVPLFLEQAEVLSAAASEQGTIGQRSRWEQGFLAVAAAHALPLVGNGLAKLNRKAILLGLHLLVPPLTLLLAVCGLFAVLLACAAILTGDWKPFASLASSLAAAMAGVLINWAFEGRAWLSLRALATFPFYFLWKLPVYGRLIAGKRVGWVRTERD